MGNWPIDTQSYISLRKITKKNPQKNLQQTKQTNKLLKNKHSKQLCEISKKQKTNKQNNNNKKTTKIWYVSRHCGHTRGWCPFIEHVEQVGCWIQTWHWESGTRPPPPPPPPSVKASQHHYAGYHCQNTSHHLGRQTSNGVLWISFRTPSMQSSKINFICLRCQPFISQTSIDLSSNGLDSTYQGKPDFFSQIYGYRWDVGPPLPSRDEWAIEVVETPRLSTCDVRKQGDGLHLLWCRSVVGGLPRQVSHYNRSLLCWSSETTDQVDSARKADKRSVLTSE